MHYILIILYLDSIMNPRLTSYLCDKKHYQLIMLNKKTS